MRVFLVILLSVCASICSAALTWQSDKPLRFVVGQPADIQLVATGSTFPVEFSIVGGGELLPGVSLSASGHITGIPQHPGFSFDGVDSYGNSYWKFTVNIVAYEVGGSASAGPAPVVSTLYPTSPNFDSPDNNENNAGPAGPLGCTAGAGYARATALLAIVFIVGMIGILAARK